MSFWKPGRIAPGSSIDRTNETSSQSLILTSSIKSNHSLPIHSNQTPILYSIESYPINIIIGQTGCGKSTQLTQFLYQAGWCTQNQKIACTQPRRVAVINLAQRVAEEMGEGLGDLVGYTVRFEDLSSPTRTKIKYLTDGVLFREVLMDPLLSSYSVIIIDEAHERSTYTDLLLGVLKKIQLIRPELRIIICSATIDAQHFKDYFNYNPTLNLQEDKCNIISLEGRMYPVEIVYKDQPVEDYLSAVVSTAMEIHLTQPKGDILIFLTGREEIDEVCSRLLEESDRLPSLGLKLRSIPFHAGLSPEEQLYAFESPRSDVRKIVVATNVAEASVTIDGIVYVIDSGLVKVRMYNPLKEMDVLTVVPISKASAIQRSGRAGRTKAGKCFRLYTEPTFQSLEAQSSPEICRIELSKMILELKALGIKNVVRGFEFVDSPNHLLIERGLEFLVALGALDLQGDLTEEFGLKMAEMPIDPMMAKILLNSEKFSCSEEILTIAAMTSVQNVFMIGGEYDVQGELHRRKFTVTEGDHLTYLNVYNAFITVGRSTAKWCQKYRLNFKALSRAISIRSQLKQYLKKFSIRLVSTDDQLKIRMCLMSGYFRNLARFNEDGSYSSVRDGTVLHVHPSSVMFNRKPETGWVIFHEVMETKKRFIRDLTVIEADWLPELAGHYYQVLDKKGRLEE